MNLRKQCSNRRDKFIIWTHPYNESLSSSNVDLTTQTEVRQKLLGLCSFNGIKQNR